MYHDGSQYLYRTSDHCNEDDIDDEDPQQQQQVEHHAAASLYWTAMELWYNHTDRYRDAIRIFGTVLEQIDPLYNENISSSSSSSHTGNIDELEEQWKTVLDQYNSQTQQSHHTPRTNSRRLDVFIIQLYIFLAGTYLDDQQYNSARQCLSHVIINYLLPHLVCFFHHQQRLQLLSASSTSSINLTKNIVESPGETNDTVPYPISHITNWNIINNSTNTGTDVDYQLLAKALQEYISTYTEEEIELQLNTSSMHTTTTTTTTTTIRVPSFIIGRRIAVLRNALFQMSSSPLSATTGDNSTSSLQDHGTTISPSPLPTTTTTAEYYWNPDSIYQRPPYYIHYPNFLKSISSIQHQQQEALMPPYEFLDASQQQQEQFLKKYHRPILQRKAYPEWCMKLEEHFDRIHQEVMEHYTKVQGYPSSSSSMHKVGSGTHRNNTGLHDGTVISKTSEGSWYEMVLFSSHSNNPNPQQDRSTVLPRTKQLIQQYCYDDVLTLVQTGIGEVIISILEPYTYILPHTSSHNIRYTAHLPIIVPKSKTTTAIKTTNDDSTPTSECYIRVGDQICYWEVGKMLCFDDSYEHEVINNTNEVRIVLLIRFWHPLLSSIHAGSNTEMKVNEQQHAALSYIEHLQNTDQLQRYNPPLLLSFRHNNQSRDKQQETMKAHEEAILARSMEQTTCPCCYQTGYASIRVMTHHRPIMMCVCGQPIV